MLRTQATVPNGVKAEAVDIQKARKGCSGPLDIPRPIVRTCQRASASFAISVHELLVICRVDNIVGEIDQELSKAALGGSVVPQNRGESSISERLG